MGTFIIIGDSDSHKVVCLKDIIQIEADTLNPNDVNYYIILAHDPETSISISFETYALLLEKLKPEDMRTEGYQQCPVCGGYPVAFTDYASDKQGVFCSKDPTAHRVTCKVNTRHCASHLYDSWNAGVFGDVTSISV